MKLKIIYNDENIQIPQIRHHKNLKGEMIVEEMVIEAPIITADIDRRRQLVTVTVSSTKRCSKCGKNLPPENFNRKTSSTTGLQSLCIKCNTRVKKRIYKKKKKEKEEREADEEAYKDYYKKVKNNEDE